MSEVDELGQALGRTGAALLSTALVLARETMRRRQERAEQATRENEQRQRDHARQLNAERELAAVQWRRVNLQQWFRESPQEVAEVWASAAAWAPHDDRAREALDSLNTMLDRYGVMGGEVAEIARATGNYGALSKLLAQGAEEAQQRTEQAHARGETSQPEQPGTAADNTASVPTDVPESGAAGAGVTTPSGEQSQEPVAAASPPREVDYEILVTSRGGEPRVWLTGPGTVAEAIAQLRLAAELREHLAEPETLLEYRVSLTPRYGEPPFALNGAGLAPQVAGQLRSIATRIGNDYGESGQDYTDGAAAHPQADVQIHPATQTQAEPYSRLGARAGAEPDLNPAMAAVESARLDCQIVITPHNGEAPGIYGGAASVEEVSQWLEWIAAHTEQGHMSAEPSTYTYDVRMSLEDGQAPASFAGDGDSSVIGQHLRWIGTWAQHETGYGHPSGSDATAWPGAGHPVAKEATQLYSTGAAAARMAGLSFAETAPARAEATAGRSGKWSHPVLNALAAWRREDQAGEQVGQIYRDAAATAKLAGKGFVAGRAAHGGARHRRVSHRSAVSTSHRQSRWRPGQEQGRG